MATYICPMCGRKDDEIAANCGYDPRELLTPLDDLFGAEFMQWSAEVDAALPMPEPEGDEYWGTPEGREVLGERC